MSKSLTNISFSIPAVHLDAPYPSQRIVNGQPKEVRRILGLKNTEEEISEIIAQSLNPDLSFEPFDKKLSIEILLEYVKKFETGNEIDKKSAAKLQLRIDGAVNELHENARLKFLEAERFRELKILGVSQHLTTEEAKNFRDLELSDFAQRSKIAEELHQNTQAKLSETDNPECFEPFDKEKKEILEAIKEAPQTIADKYSNSLELFNQLVECAPEKLWVHYDRGKNLMRMGRFEEAVLDFEKELEINQSEHCKEVCTFAKADAHYSLGDFEKAKSGFKYLLQIQGESQDQIFDSAKEKLESLEARQKFSSAKKQRGKEAYYSSVIAPAFNIFCASFVLIAIARAIHQQDSAVNQQDNVINREASSDSYRDQKEDVELAQSFARTIYSWSLDYDELADHVVENFHRLPENFFQRIIKSSSTQELTAFLNEQQFLDAEQKKILVKNFIELKKYEKDQISESGEYLTNPLRHFLLKYRDSQNHQNDPKIMVEAIKNFEEEISRAFQECCENLLSHKKIKPLLAGLVSNVEDLLIAPAKDSNAVMPREILESFETKTPSTSPSTTDAKAELKSSQKKGNSDSIR